MSELGKALKNRLKQSKFESIEQEALLNLLIAAHYTRPLMEEAPLKYKLTHSQYNVLRILKGAYPNGYARYEIASRMIEPSPDVTRLVDRLVRMGLVGRSVSSEDRRMSIARINSGGLKLLDQMFDDVNRFDNEFLAGTLSKKECRELSRICEKIYAKT